MRRVCLKRYKAMVQSRVLHECLFIEGLGDNQMAKRNRKETREIEEQLRKEAEQERKKTRIFLIIGVVIVVAILVYALYERVFSQELSL